MKSTSGFSRLNTLFGASCKCLCTHFGHMTTIKTSLNILIRIIEHNNQLPDYLFLYRIWLTIFAKSFILDVWQGSEYASVQ